MTISYPLSLPATNFKRLTVRANQAVAMVSNPYTGQTQVFKNSRQLWVVEVTFPPFERADAEAWICFLLKLNGSYGTFQCGDPKGSTLRGVGGGAPVCDGVQTPGGSSLLIKGLPASITNIYRAGDYLQIGTHLYKNLSDANSSGAGKVTLDVWPDLRDDYANNTAIVTSNTRGLFRLIQQDIPIYTVDEGGIYDVFFTGVEAIP